MRLIGQASLTPINYQALNAILLQCTQIRGEMSCAGAKSLPWDVCGR